MKFRATLVTFLLLVSSRPGHALIGGLPALDWTVDKVLGLATLPSIEEKVFPSVVLLSMGCTGTVVGPRHILTAAHCVVMDDTTRRLRMEMLPGNTLLFDTRARWTLREDYLQSWSHQARIVRTLVHPSYLYASLNDNYPENTGDVAIIVVDRDIGTRETTRRALEAKLLPIADIDYEALGNPEGARLVKLGYGCESKTASGLLTTTSWNLKFAVFDGLPDQEEALKKAATYQKYVFKSVFSSFYWVSKAWGYDDTDAATNCPGDSGGALYHISSQGLKVAGVNSRSRLENKENGTYRTWVDFHTRLDEGSALRVDLWLKRALKYPEERWFSGIAYLPIVPRDAQLARNGYAVTTQLRDDLYVKSTLWLAFLDGIGGTCPLRFKSSLELRGADSRGAQGRVTARNSRPPGDYGRFVLTPAPGAGVPEPQVPSPTDPGAVTFTARELRAELEPVEVPARERAGICYLSVFALE